MEKKRKSATIVPVVVGSLILAACASTPAPSPTPSQSLDMPIPEAIGPMLNPIDEDATLVLTTTATAANGAALTLQMQVHRATSWDDIANQAMPDALVADCPDRYSLNELSSDQWAFTRVQVAIISVAGSADWPAEAAAEVRPRTSSDPVVARGDNITLTGSDTDSLCDRSTLITGPGNFGLALGIAGDAPAWVGWTRHGFGFVSQSAVLSECSIEVTAVGVEQGAQSGAWSERVDDTHCVAGAGSDLD